MEQLSSSPWKKGEAIVTGAGIEFQLQLYTCRQAIKEKWFERAMHVGGWNIGIVYHASRPSVIHIDSDEQNEWNLCRTIPAAAEPAYGRESYFAHMQKLKEMRRSRK